MSEFNTIEENNWAVSVTNRLLNIRVFDEVSLYRMESSNEWSEAQWLPALSRERQRGGLVMV